LVGFVAVGAAFTGAPTSEARAAPTPDPATVADDVYVEYF
jgi:hypothetical protein